jgi:P27 family predicted phage terminase small subunit
MANEVAMPTTIRNLMGNTNQRNALHFEAHPDCMDEAELNNPPFEFVKGETSQAVWRYIVPRLAKYGLATEIDVPALARYCNAMGAALDAQAEIVLHVEKKHWSMLVAEKGGAYKPVMQIRNRLIDEIKDLEMQFGMTPSARTKIAINRQMGLPGFDVPAGMNPAVARLEAFREKLGLVA